MSKRMIACDEAGFLISFRQDKRLGLFQWMQLQMHLISCHFCRKYAVQIKQLDHKVAEYRMNSDPNACRHHLSDQACTKMQATITKELNVN